MKDDVLSAGLIEDKVIHIVSIFMLKEMVRLVAEVMLWRKTSVTQ
jgi:hypothetical protein